MSVELGDDDAYPVKGLGSISFRMWSGDFIELNDVLFVLIWRKIFFHFLVWYISNKELHLTDNSALSMIVL
jgi:hypothetical protein